QPWRGTERTSPGGAHWSRKRRRSTPTSPPADSPLVQNLQQILAVAALHQARGELLELALVDEALAVGDLLDAADLQCLALLDHAVPTRIGPVVREHHAAVGIGVIGELLAERGAVEDVVAEDQRGLVAADEPRTEDEGLGQPLRPGLFRVLEPAPQLRAVAEQ